MWAKRMNSPMLYWQNILVQSRKLYGWQNRTRQHYVTLPGSTASYGERKQTRTFENHANLLAYLTNWPLYTLENGFWGVIKCQGGPFLSFAQAFSALIVRINCQNGVTCSIKARLRVQSITQLRAWAHRRSAYAQLSPLYLLSTLYITHVIKYTRPSWAGPGNEARIKVKV